MAIKAVKTELDNIKPLRSLFLQETNFQVRYNAAHERCWTDSYLLMSDDAKVGFGSIKGQEIKDRDTVFEFYLIPEYRRQSGAFFTELLGASNAKHIECQSNDPLLSAMLYEFSRDINADTVLFADHSVTEHSIPGAVVRLRHDDDRIFKHEVDPSSHVLERGGEILATGGFLTHYNPPFADLYMEVRHDCRRLGYGSFILQEVKKQCYLAGRVPAARCNIRNRASRGALLKAGMKVCGYMLLGHVKTLEPK